MKKRRNNELLETIVFNFIIILIFAIGMITGRPNLTLKLLLAMLFIVIVVNLILFVLYLYKKYLKK